MTHLWIIKRKIFLQVIIFTAAILFTIGIFYLENTNISVFNSDNDPKAIYNVQTEKKQIALTFDLSWGENNIDKILDILDDYSLKGKVTFFLSSQWSEKHPEIVKRIYSNGYEIGSHGYSHVNYTELSDEEVNNQIQKAHKILLDITGESPQFIRTPNGDFDGRVLKIANSLGYTIIQWDTDSKDWLNPGVDQIIERVLENAHPGNIILMHASDSCEQSVDALPIIISNLKKDGYEFVSISQLISHSKIKLSEIN